MNKYSSQSRIGEFISEQFSDLSRSEKQKLFTTNQKCKKKKFKTYNSANIVVKASSKNYAMTAITQCGICHSWHIIKNDSREK